MNEWKELQIDNLPPDILTGGYEFYQIGDETGRRLYFKTRMERMDIIETVIKFGTKYRYRKPEPKAPTHEEITKSDLWWNFTDKDRGWLKILYYMDGLYYFPDPFDNDFIAFTKKEFIGRESADIPPE